jgi:uncharacterized protein YdeI (YjbR/CyaY-like superfamily)
MQMEMTKHAEIYFREGCGRCPKGGTPQCKVHRWTLELALLRAWMRDMDYTEECKWGVPCYTHQGRNLVILSALQDAVVLSFLEGFALKDPYGLLNKAGPNSVRDRVIRWNSLPALKAAEQNVKSLLKQHIESSKKLHEESSNKSSKGSPKNSSKGSPKNSSKGSPKNSSKKYTNKSDQKPNVSTEGVPDYPKELVDYLKEHPEIAVAFESLTPGRRRGYLLHFAGAIQSATRLRRILAAIPLIQAGKGMQGR